MFLVIKWRFQDVKSLTQEAANTAASFRAAEERSELLARLKQQHSGQAAKLAELQLHLQNLGMLAVKELHVAPPSMAGSHLTQFKAVRAPASSVTAPSCQRDATAGQGSHAHQAAAACGAPKSSSSSPAVPDGQAGPVPSPLQSTRTQVRLARNSMFALLRDGYRY